MTGNNSTTQGKTKHTKTYRLIMQSKTDKKTNSRPNYFVWTFCLYELLLLTVPKRRGNENAYFYRCRKKILTSESDTYSDHYSTLFTPERQTSAETSLTLFPYRGVVHSTFLELTRFLRIHHNSKQHWLCLICVPEFQQDDTLKCDNKFLTETKVFAVW